MDRHALVPEHATGQTRYVLEHATGLTRYVLGLVLTSLVAASCAGSGDDGTASETIGQNAVDAIVSGRDAGCDADKRLVETALVAHDALLGYPATAMSDLAQFGVEDELGRWTLQIVGTDGAPSVVATVGGPCDG